MVLDELLSTIDELQTLIRAHGDELRHSEMATRYALINPLLRALGWRTQDPTHVGVEKKLATGRADYLLKGGDGRPVVLIEAKKLDTNLAQAREQAFKYCKGATIPYFVVTDGQHWYLYQTYHAGQSSARELVHFDVAGQATEVAVKSLALWQRNIERRVLASIVTNEAPTRTADSPRQPRQPRTQEWRQISTTFHMWRARPQSVRLPNGAVRQTWAYPELLCEIAGWLLSTGKLNRSHLPLESHPGGRNIAIDATEPWPVSEHGTWRHVEAAYVEVPTATPALMANVCRLITAAGYKPSDFQVRLR